MMRAQPKDHAGDESVRRSALRHFVTPLASVLPHKEGYVGRRLVTFLAGATGYAHALYMTVPAKTKVLSHWHTDREAIFVCVGGQGVFVLDDMEWSVSVGDALFIPLTHVHGIANPSAGTMELLDLALFSELESNASIDECRSPAQQAQWEKTEFGAVRAYFPNSLFGNPAITWVGEVSLSVGGVVDSSHFAENTEKIICVRSGEAELDYLGERTRLEAGVAVHVVSGVACSITNSGRVPVELNCSASLPGRYPEPSLFRALRTQYPAEGHAL